MYYAGIGSRKTPPDIMELMGTIAVKLQLMGYTMRSGGAVGADTAFQTPLHNDFVEIYLDELHKNNQCSDGWYNVKYFPNLAEAVDIASAIHPKWALLGNRGKALITRNTYQILGPDLRTPSEFVMCWTEDGSEGTTTSQTGGTGQAIRLAKRHNIPVYNLANECTRMMIKVWLEIY